MIFEIDNEELRKKFLEIHFLNTQIKRFKKENYKNSDNNFLVILEDNLRKKRISFSKLLENNVTSLKNNS